jgi:hypothetical protein
MDQGVETRPRGIDLVTAVGSLEDEEMMKLERLAIMHAKNQPT